MKGGPRRGWRGRGGEGGGGGGGRIRGGTGEGGGGEGRGGGGDVAAAAARHGTGVGRVAACGSGVFGSVAGAFEAGSPASDGHLLSRPPKELPPVPAATGAQPIGLDSGRDGVIYLPPGLTGPAPLFVLLHGATGSAAGITGRTGAFALADELKMVILAPDSRERTWDAIRGQFGPDVAFLDKALAKVFETVPIDRKRVAIGGFSDGASYAISLGLQNGDLFTHVAAFSPGFFVGNQRRGRPLFYVRTASATRSCRSTRPAAASCRRSRRPTTASASRNSTARTPCRPRLPGKRSSGSPAGARLYGTASRTLS